jgi:predicted nuclease of predicted toxin-antitoxin system
MRWLLDQGIPHSVVGLLRDLGYHAEHVRDLGYAKATDSQILELGLRLESVVVTLDADFHSLLALSGAPKPSVVRLREEGLKGEAVVAILAAVVDVAEKELLAGCAASYAGGKLRFKMLPIIFPRADL